MEQWSGAALPCLEAARAQQAGPEGRRMILLDWVNFKLNLALLLLLTCSAQNTLPAPANTRVAVCFWGLTRSLWATRDSLRVSILDPLIKEGYTVQKFLHTFAVEQEKGSRVIWDDYKWLEIPASQVIVEKPEAADHTADTPSLDLLAKPGDGWHDKFHSLSNHRLALHSLKAVTALWTARAGDFDVVIYTRTDLWYFRQLDIAEIQQVLTSPPSIFTPNWDMWNGAMLKTRRHEVDRLLN
ncbi:hypothetical protein WJX74_000234 [Apatococcus lobatus]|uniref:Uncharacterized protein n=1 Tax=Apatococcus lobatus TaxID=904363 RepID=A0AAW1RAE0_9CHLO